MLMLREEATSDTITFLSQFNLAPVIGTPSFAFRLRQRRKLLKRLAEGFRTSEFFEDINALQDVVDVFEEGFGSAFTMRFA